MKNIARTTSLQPVYFFFLLFIFFWFLPVLLRANYQNDFCLIHQLMWRNFLGAGFRLPFEAPKPLLAFLNGVVPQRFIYFLPPCFAALWVVSLGELSRKITGTYINGFFAAIICLFCNREVIPGFFLFNRWPMIYIPLIFLQILLFLQKRYGLCFSINFLTSLIRPVSWLYTLVFITYLYFKKERIRPAYFLPLAAPLIWAFFDYRISGDWFYSYNCRVGQLVRYFSASLPPSGSNPFFFYWGKVAQEIFTRYSPSLIIAGFLFLLLIAKSKDRSFKKTNILSILALVPFLLYWFLFIKGNTVVASRFFTFSVGVMIFYVTLAVPFLLKKTAYRKYLNLFYLIMLVVFSLNISDFKWALAKVRRSQAAREAAAEAGDFLKDNAGLLQSASLIAVPARRESYFSLLVGESDSRKIATFADILSGFCGENLTGLAIFIDYESAGYAFFRKARRISTADKTYSFEPLYITKNNLGIVYNILER